jgi:hypothetical protein
MRRLGLVFTLFCLFLTACAAPPAEIPAASPSSSARTTTPSAILTPALNLTPDTSTPDTPTITPLPTIPTFTPTFDVRTIVTATPAPRSECPTITSAKNASLDFLNLFSDEDNRINIEKNLLGFLNKYGAQALYTAIKSQDYHDEPFLQDLTNDEELEIIVRPLSTYVFGCKSGQYIKLLQLPPDTSMTAPKLLFINDANRNGIPEITFLTARYSKGGRTYRIYEWNNDSFVSLLDIPIYEDDIGSGGVFVTVSGEIHFEDIDDDLVQELIVDNGDYVQWAMEPGDLPWRNERIYYKWDGKYFTQWRREFAPPEYRFQSIQDGDLAISQQEYEKALDFYQQAIFNNELKGYSPAMQENLRANHFLDSFSNQPTLTPPAPDRTEYPRLAAYAYYRMVILHTFLGEMDAVQVKYATLQEKFPAGSPGHPYVEMATGFWSAYQSSGRMYDACAAAIAYADAHPEILVPLGSNYHGAQSHRYHPADVCPFR